jgi:hypothetical protein
MKFIYLILTVILLTSCDYKSNKTIDGDFWYYGRYCQDIEPNEKDIEASMNHLTQYHNAFVLDGIQVIAVYRFVQNDPSIYYKGSAEMKNDTLFLDIKDESKLSYYFDNEMQACAAPFTFYFTINEKPKTIYLFGQPIDSVRKQIF